MWIINGGLTLLFGGLVYFGYNSINELNQSILDKESEINIIENYIDRSLRQFINNSIIEQQENFNKGFLISELEMITESLANNEESESSVILKQAITNKELKNEVNNLQRSLSELSSELSDKNLAIERIQRIASGQELGEIYIVLDSINSEIHHLRLTNRETKVPVRPAEIKGIGFNFSYIHNEQIELTRGRAMLEVRVSKKTQGNLERLFSYNIPLKGVADRYVNNLFHYELELTVGNELNLERGASYEIILEDLQNRILLCRRGIIFDE